MRRHRSPSLSAARLGSLSLVVLAALTGCGRSEASPADAGREGRGRDTRGDGVRIAVGEAAEDSAAASRLGPGDVEVRSVDGAMLLAVVGDSVRIRLSDSLRTAVRSEVGTAIPGDTADQGLGGLVGRVVARSVDAAIGTAMGTVVRIPVAEIRDARCEGGRLRFRTRDGKDGSTHVHVSGTRRRGGKDDGLRFAEADCRRFVEAVTDRQGTLPAHAPGARGEAW